MKSRDNLLSVRHCPNCKDTRLRFVVKCSCCFLGCSSCDGSNDGCFGRRCPWCGERDSFEKVGLTMNLETVLEMKEAGFIAKAALAFFCLATAEHVKDSTTALEAFCDFGKVMHEAEEAERLEEVRRKETCQCEDCVAEREEKRRKQEEDEESRRQYEDEDYSEDGSW